MFLKSYKLVKKKNCVNIMTYSAINILIFPLSFSMHVCCCCFFLCLWYGIVCANIWLYIDGFSCLYQFHVAFKKRKSINQRLNVPKDHWQSHIT